MIAKGLTGFNAHHFFGVYRIHHGDVIGEYRALAGDFADAEAIQRRKRIWPQLDTCANLTDLMRLFQQHHFDPPIPPPTITARVTLVIMVLLVRLKFYLVDFLALRQ